MNAFARIPLLLVTLALTASAAAAALVSGAFLYLEPGLPEAEEIRAATSSLQTPLGIYSRDGRLMQLYGAQKRTPARFDEIPELLRQAVIAAEDDRFYEHRGIDIVSTIRAVLNYGLSRVTGSGRVAGGSTITQQITRTTDLMSRDYSVGRKISEIFLAFRIEREFTKDEILGIYLNTYFFGQRSYGVVSAARTYFNKTLDELTLSEIAIIAGIPTAPSVNNPYNGPENAERRRDYVLRRLYELGHIDAASREAARVEPIAPRLYDLELELEASYVAQMAIEWCLARFGADVCSGEGLKITTTIDSRLQRAANSALRDALIAYDRNHGYRGPIGHVDFAALGLAMAEPADAGSEAEGDENGDPEIRDPDDRDGAAVDLTASGASAAEMLDTLLADYPAQLGTETAIVTAVDEPGAEIWLRGAGPATLDLEAVGWAREYRSANARGAVPSTVADVLTPGDIIRVRRLPAGGYELAQIPDIQGALVSVDPQDGAVAALIGGDSFAASEFTRATQGLRQPGSAFKPFFYLSALDRGYTLSTLVNDAPVRYYDTAQERERSVENYEGTYGGPTRLREVLINSLNAPADRVIRDIGPGYVGNYVERFGFDPRPEDRNTSLALGSLGVTPLALANGYAILANGGYAVGIRPDPDSPPMPYYVQRVETADGALLYDASLSVERVCETPEESASGWLARPAPESLVSRPSELFPPLRCAERVESAQRIFLITDVLKEVVRRGSGARAGRAFPNRADLAGKTGTTNGPRDAWFAGFNADLVAVVRVGFDDDTRELGNSEQGGRTAIPAWIDYMNVALAGQPDRALPRPPGIVEHRIDLESGLIAAECNRNTDWEYFLIGYVPEREPDSRCFSPGSAVGPGSGAGPGAGSGAGPGAGPGPVVPGGSGGGDDRIFQ